MTELPTTFGKYFLTDKLATGGMAEIFLGKLIGPGGFEKQLVIKQIHPELTGRDHFVDLFVAEAKTLVNLSHGNIVPIYELGVVDDRYFIAMEYIDGPTLEELIKAHWDRDEAIDPNIAAYIAAEIYKGLDYAHRKGSGIIHRDLSPRNVLVSRDGEVKLLDFGIAVTLEGQDPQAEATDGKPAGSFPYMSPEQVGHQQLTGQSDIFSAGVLLWEMLTGTRLFHRDTAEETLRAVTNEPVPAPSSRRASIPEALDEFCARALARPLAERFSEAGDALASMSRHLYSIDKPVTARQISKLIASYCPPTVHHDPGDGEPAERTEVNDDLGSTAVVDRTVPMGDRAEGKGRARTETFATNVAFVDVIAKATPLFPISAIRDLPGMEDAAEEPEAAAAALEAKAVADGEPNAGAAVAGSEPPPSRVVPWIAAAVLLIATIGIGVLTVQKMRGAVADAPIDAAPRVVVAPIDAGIVAVVDARVRSAAADAAPPPDARKRRVIKRRSPDAAPAVQATGTLVVPANPWGEVYLNGRKLGRAPNRFVVPVGKHTVVVKFPPKKLTRTFKAVVVVKGKVKTLGMIDFRGEP